MLETIKIEGRGKRVSRIGERCDHQRLLRESKGNVNASQSFKSRYQALENDTQNIKNRKPAKKRTPSGKTSPGNDVFQTKFKLILPF